MKYACYTHSSGDTNVCLFKNLVQELVKLWDYTFVSSKS